MKKLIIWAIKTNLINTQSFYFNYIGFKIVYQKMQKDIMM